MTPERWAQIERIFNAALSRSVDARELYLDQECGADADLRHEVDSLLAVADLPGFIDEPAWNPNLLAAAPDEPLATGSWLGPYRLTGVLGEGGMGRVYSAEDTRLRRTVAIKVSSCGFEDRFPNEARAAAALNHPNICTLHDIGPNYLVMELVEGETLAVRIRKGPLPLAESLSYARQIAAALESAHQHGVIHRDLKPGNIKIKPDGTVKVIDFGLARVRAVQPGGNPENVALTTATLEGAVIGTPAYMAPEQLTGHPVDHRADIWAFGVVLFEMLTGRRVFEGASSVDTVAAVMKDSPRLDRLPRDTPSGIRKLVDRCLEKDPALRMPQIGGALSVLRPEPRMLAGRRLALVSVIGLILVSSAAGWLYFKNSRARWARLEALPEIRRLAGSNANIAAYDLAKKALQYSSDDPDLNQLWTNLHSPISLTSNPPGVKVSYRAYGDSVSLWRLVGVTPFSNVTAPSAYLTWRAELEGYEPVELAGLTLLLDRFQFEMIRKGKVPLEMVLIPEKAPSNGYPANPPLPDFFIDRYEVTNDQFKTFMDRGAYLNPELWKHGFRKAGRDLTFANAMQYLRDSTGQPGPAHWRLGTFPSDQSRYPVAGVSWYEAVAYCESQGKSLPTVGHWRRAASFSMFADILQFSNFSGRGAAAVGANAGVSPFGVYDMAGNVKEWNWNASDAKRAILGGGWNETSYMFTDADAQDPFTRGVSYGFRCAQYITAPKPGLLAAIDLNRNLYKKTAPVDDKTFKTLSRLYAYDKVPLDAKTEYRNTSNENWIKEKVNFRAGYNQERMAGYLYLPTKGKAPFQVVIHGPGGYAHHVQSSETGLRVSEYGFLAETGRAVFAPVFKGTFERRSAPNAVPDRFREFDLQYIKDISRAVDFLESRADIDRDRIGYYGISSGAWHGVFGLALEPRIKAAALLGGGLLPFASAPELEVHNFAPRLRMPVLMLNGRQDFAYPLKESQEPLFRLLGTPEADKRHALFEGGHVPPANDMMREVLGWFDRYLGPVVR